MSEDAMASQQPLSRIGVALDAFIAKYDAAPFELID